MGANRRILIVDDQEDLRLQVAKLLQQRSAAKETSSLIEQIRNRISRGREVARTDRTIEYRVDHVAQGKDAFEMVKESFSANAPYALVFLDMRMPPGWDGLETAQRIRSIDKEIQIVIMTAYADYEQQEIAERIGEPDKLIYLKKPFHPEEIRQLALALTEKWNMNRREKERVILTNRLMRENSHLTKRAFKSLETTYRSILDAFLFFLDARSGVLVRKLGEDRRQVCAVSPEPEEPKLLKAYESAAAAGSARMVTDDAKGTALFPIRFDDFDGGVYLEGKNLVFSFEQLSPFLEILLETSREVLKNAFLLETHSEEQRLRTAGVAMNRVTREVREALDHIRTLTRTLRTEESAERRGELCDAIEAAGVRLLDPCLDVTQFAAGDKVELKWESVTPEALLERAVTRFTSRIAKESIVVGTDTADAPEAIRCDPDRLERALAHLVVNAIDAIAARPAGAPPGRITLSVGRKRDRVTIAVTDNGTGVSEAAADTMFVPLGGRQGTEHGIGTAIAKQIVERHAGSIAYSTEVGKGTTFTISLPATQPTGQ